MAPLVVLKQFAFSIENTMKHTLDNQDFMYTLTGDHHSLFHTTTNNLSVLLTWT
jgi:hypothetical protein